MQRPLQQRSCWDPQLQRHCQPPKASLQKMLLLRCSRAWRLLLLHLWLLCLLLLEAPPLDSLAFSLQQTLQRLLLLPMRCTRCSPLEKSNAFPPLLPPLLLLLLLPLRLLLPPLEQRGHLRGSRTFCAASREVSAAQACAAPPRWQQQQLLQCPSQQQQQLPR